MRCAHRSLPRGTLGRNALRAAPLRQLDVALSRRFSLAGRVTLQTRVDAFNVLNVVNPAAPEARLTFANFGRPEQTRADALGTGSLTRGGLTPVHQLGGPRSIQFGVRVDW
jgi:hypothetical protein